MNVLDMFRQCLMMLAIVSLIPSVACANVVTNEVFFTEIGGTATTSVTRPKDQLWWFEYKDRPTWISDLKVDGFSIQGNSRGSRVSNAPMEEIVELTVMENDGGPRIWYYEVMSDDMPVWVIKVVQSSSLTSGLVAHYKFDGNANDSSGNGNDGVVKGATLTTDRFGNVDSAYRFSSSFIEVPANALLNSVTNYTLLAWVKVDTWSALPIMSKGVSTRQYGLEIGSDGVYDLSHGYNGGSLRYYTSIEPFVGEWAHVAVSLNGREVHAYLNGMRVDTSENTTDYVQAPVNEENLYIGVDYPGVTEFLNGDLDDVRLYNRALSADEVKAIYTDGDDPIVYRTVNFDANGGTCATDSAVVSNRAAVGELPTATRSNYTFLGWFTAAVGGEQVSSETMVTNDVTWYAQWMATYTVIVGAKASVDVGLKGQGYSTKTLPKGLTYSDKTGLVTGTCKTATAAEGVEVTFTKKNAEDVVVNFVVRKENEPTVECVSLTNGAFVVGVAGGGRGATALPIGIDAESGVKSVTATKLPTGMKIASSKDKTSWYVTGAPTKAGTYEVAITLTTAAGNKVTETFTVEVEALPSGATGTFNGFVVVGALGDRALPDGETVNVGSLQVTVSDVGKITAKVVAAAGTYSFTATGWDSVTGGVYYAAMTTKKGDVLTLACDSGAAWNTHQMTGAFTAVGGATALPGGDSATTYAVEAQKNAFGKQWFFKATGDDANGWTLSFAESAKAAALTVTLNADGKTTIAGTLYGVPVTDGKKTTTPAYKVSASGYADVSGIGTGAIFADFAPVISVKSGKTTTKKVLSLRANLWFDKKNDHEEGVGSAVFAP